MQQVYRSILYSRCIDLSCTAGVSILYRRCIYLVPQEYVPNAARAKCSPCPH